MTISRFLCCFLGFAVTGASLGAPPAAAEDPTDYADQVLAVAEGELQEWITDPFILYAILEQNETYAAISEDEIASLDARWIGEHGRGPMINDLLGRQASVILRDRRAASSGVITEIIVMDAQGLNVAISDPTSDYYQGDEAKWRETFLLGPEAVHVGEIAFDESTQKVQTQVSLTVTDPDSAAPIGAVTFGVDLAVLRN